MSVSTTRVVVEADGGSRGNPGPAGYGSVVFDAGSGAVLAERSESLGVQTNNFAEYNGLIAGLRAAIELGATVVAVRMDSKLVVEQMRGTWQAKHAGMRDLRDEARALARQFDDVSYQWIPREQNKHADRLANAAMDRAAGLTPKSAPPAPSTSATSVSADPVSSVAPVSSAPVSSASVSASVSPTPTTAMTTTAVTTTAVAPAAAAWTPPVGATTRLVLVRHGATAHSGPRLFSGRNELPLAPDGERQAAALGARFCRTPDIAAIISSPYRRARQTAQAIVDAAGVGSVQVADGLAELDFGVWEGLGSAEVTARWGAEFAAFAEGETPAPQGESFADVAARVARTRDEILAAHPGQTLLLVTHVTPIKTLLRLALAAPQEALFRIHLDTASVSIVDYPLAGSPSVRLMNDTSHLTAL